MERSTIKTIGKWLMVIGAGAFTAGAGVNFACACMDRVDSHTEHINRLNKIEEDKERNKAALMLADSEAKRVYAEKVTAMNSDDFARYHAERVAKVNKEVADRANASVVNTKLKCEETINEIRSECIKKIEEANKQRDDAVKKYESINYLFTNKDEIVEAKKALESAVKVNNDLKKNKEELMESIKDLLS